MTPDWLKWIRELSAIAQNGLAYTKDIYDRERFERMQEILSEMISARSDGDAPQIKDLLSGEQGYTTPKVDVRGAAFSEQGILLVRERSDGLWTLPGGWADVTESPAEAIVKEIREESGFTARVVKLAAVYDRNKHPHPPNFFSIYKCFFLCEITGGAPSDSIETDGVGFFAEHSLPPLSLARVTEAQIQRVFQHYRQPNLPTDFD